METAILIVKLFEKKPSYKTKSNVSIKKEGNYRYNAKPNKLIRPPCGVS
jgi:hypothetical protein